MTDPSNFVVDSCSCLQLGLPWEIKHSIVMISGTELLVLSHEWFPWGAVGIPPLLVLGALYSLLVIPEIPLPGLQEI